MLAPTLHRPKPYVDHTLTSPWPDNFLVGAYRLKVTVSACAKSPAMRDQNWNEINSFTICVSCLVVLLLIILETEGRILLISLHGLSTLWRLSKLTCC